MKKLVFLMGLIPLILQGEVVTRSSVISSALGYTTLGWRVNATNPRYPIYILSGVPIIGEAYSFGDKSTTGTFISEINAGLIPRNWEDPDNPSHPANPSSEYTGIDCSGLVTRCWCFGNQVDWLGVSHLYNYTIEITGEPTAGDLWWSSHHVFLQSEVSGSYYEANPRGWEEWNGGNRVQYLSRVTSGFTPRSIFPQFSDDKPEDEEILEDTNTVNISLTIKASGNLVSGGVNMVVNGVQVSNPDLQPQGDNTWTLTATDYDVSDGGKFDVKVMARNDVTISQASPPITNGYLDEYNWWFIVNQDSTPPVVVSTDPSNGAQEVQVDVSPISIIFSKLMKTNGDAA